MYIIKNIKQELKQKIDLEYKQGSVNFFKEPIKLYGVRTPVVKKIANKYFKEVKNLEKKEIFKLIEELMRSNYNEEFSIASSWLYKIRGRLDNDDFPLLSSWVKKYITNWAMCDDYCTHAFGYLIYKHPNQLIPKLKQFAKSSNRWVKRAGAVSHIHPTKQSSPFRKNIEKNKQKYLKDIFYIADNLLLDADDLVQKGYGWMLKEASNLFEKDIFNYVISKKKIMPRTALRYAIEKMPTKLKKQAMAK